MPPLPIPSPTRRLLVGLAVTLVAVGAFSWAARRQVAALRQLQAETVDRNRRDSLQLLRIQNDLNSLALALRDMLDEAEPYPLAAWRGQLERIREDLDDALRREAALAPASRTQDQQRYLAQSLRQLWLSAGQMFAAADAGREPEARAIIRNTLQAQQAALATAVSRLLVQNNEAEERAVAEAQATYDRVDRTLLAGLVGAAGAILATSLSLIRANRRLFDQLAELSRQRGELAHKLIHVQEGVLRSVARELHDEFGQVLTAIGTLLGRVERKALPPESPYRADLQEVRAMAQSTLERTRSLTQMLHPTILTEHGLQGAVAWYVPTFGRQTGLRTHYDPAGQDGALPEEKAIHVYRILQEALNNVVRHAGADEAWVRLRHEPGQLVLEVEDHGRGLPEVRSGRGLGLVAMRERAGLLGGSLRVSHADPKGTLVRLEVPLSPAEARAPVAS